MYVVRRTYKDLEILHLAGDFTHLRNALFYEALVINSSFMLN